MTVSGYSEGTKSEPRLWSDDELVAFGVPEDLVKVFRRCEAALRASDRYFDEHYQPRAGLWRGTFREALDPAAQVRYLHQMKSDEARDEFEREQRSLQDFAHRLADEVRGWHLPRTVARKLGPYPSAEQWFNAVARHRMAQARGD
jgi:hypothetical protein